MPATTTRAAQIQNSTQFPITTENVPTTNAIITKMTVVQAAGVEP